MEFSGFAKNQESFREALAREHTGAKKKKKKCQCIAGCQCYKQSLRLPSWCSYLPLPAVAGARMDWMVSGITQRRKKRLK